MIRVGSLSIRCILMLAVLCLFCAASAAANPTWQFNGTPLVGSEKVVGDAVLASYEFAGLTTTCKKMHYAMTIFNSAGTGQLELKSLSLTKCVADEEFCFVESSEAEALPWTGHLSTIGGSDYLILKGVKLGLLYGDQNCVIGEFPFAITGSAGALFEDPTESFSFDASTFSTTGTKLVANGSVTLLDAGFTTEATGVHEGESLTVG
jgi:hypothetical protein